MTCAHVVNVALKKVPGVESVDVSLNKGLATVKLKSGNTVSVPQLWQLIHNQGYTPKATAVSVVGEIANAQGKTQLRVAGTKEVISLAPNAKNPGPFNDASKKVGQSVFIHGVMTPGKDFKVNARLEVDQIK
jgi:copper chaperone CopZ